MEALLQIFARPPVAGKVKTRLIPGLGAQGACDVYRNMLWRTIEVALQSFPATQVQLWASEKDKQFISSINIKYNIEVFEQKGNNLGERMQFSLAQGLQSHQKVLLIGTDCPALAAKHYVKLEVALDSHEVAYIPAEDGGFVAIGCTTVSPHWFENINWGSDSVMQSTVNRLKDEKYTLLAPKLRDLDTFEDYQWYQKHQPF